ncbi:hypothetical protein [Marivita hallyeonensis]|uniref:hypothetical protein n=1 Tax=Marivita hallyeonensis TaxID=996342 RepID=UPI00116087D8|nr:hypothetical protein [Marivita hallyeonensis]
MQPLDHKKLQLVFAPKDCPTFSDIIDRVLSDPALSQARARDMVSGLRRVSKALGRSSADVPADPKWLQPRLQKIAPAALGLTPKS